MAGSNNPFRGGNIVHRIELPRRRRLARRVAAERVGSSAEPHPPAVPPHPTSPSGPNGPTRSTGRTPRAAQSGGFAPDPAHSGPLQGAGQGVVNVEFEVLDRSQVPHAQLTRAQERQDELELALERENDAQQSLKLEHRQEIEVLERRLTKLRGLVEAQEVDLRRAVAEGQIDSGWASCYRDVQGLDMTAPDAELKREMLAQIFQANRLLQARIASLGA